MKKNILIISIGCLVVFMLTGTSFAQNYNRKEKRITVVNGKKQIIKGAVRDTDEIAYSFKARAGQRLTVRVVGRDADFKLNILHSFDFEPLAEDTKFWSGRLPANVDGKLEIVVHSNYKVADYQLEILLK